MSKIKDIVNNLVKKYYTRNPYELCDFLNIPILYNNLGNIKGLFQNVQGAPIIHLNNSLSEDELKPVLAHELGHALLHKEFNVCFLSSYTFYITNKFENEANEFASHLLIDDKELDTFYVGYEYVTLEELSKYFCIPIEIVEYKFK